MYKIELTEDELRWIRSGLRDEINRAQRMCNMYCATGGEYSDSVLGWLSGTESLSERLRSTPPQDRREISLAEKLWRKRADNMKVWLDEAREEIARLKEEDTDRFRGFKLKESLSGKLVEDIRDDRLHAFAIALSVYQSDEHKTHTFGGGMCEIPSMYRIPPEFRRIVKETPHRFDSYFINGLPVYAAEHKIGDVQPEGFENLFLQAKMGDKRGKVVLVRTQGFVDQKPGVWVETVKEFKRKAKKF